VVVFHRLAHYSCWGRPKTVALPLKGAPTDRSVVSSGRRVARAEPVEPASPETVETGPPRKLDPASLPDHVDRLYRAAWALSGSREEAEDLVQETFARVLEKPRLLRSDDDIGYLLRVLRNTFLSSRRTAGRRPATVTMPEEFEAADRRTGGSPEVGLAVAETFAAIASLPDKLREALVAVDVVGLTYREAGRALGTREATITSRLFRARQQVVRTLDGIEG
jgi:RNA polymerase sigma-70 factor (ECF subfamily)